MTTPITEHEAVKVSLRPLPQQYIWNNSRRDRFAEELSSAKFKEEVDKMMSKDDHPNLIFDIKKLLIETAEHAKVKKTQHKPSTQDAPWFDKECKALKGKITTCGKLLRSEPNNTTARENLYVTKKKLRNLIRKNKFQHKKSLVEEMCTNLSRRDQKLYWKQLKKLEGHSKTISYLRDQELIDHFKDILNDPEAPTNPLPDLRCDHGTLDQAISLEELSTGKKILKPGKSPGIGSHS